MSKSTTSMHSTSSMARWLGAVLVSLAMMQSHTAFGQSPPGNCGSLENGYGPYDYRTDKEKLPIVLGAHFTPLVEELIRGTTSTSPGGDIDYTLRAIPNNPRALWSMMRLAERENTQKPSGSRYTIECWFVRALQFRSDDHVVRMLYVTYLTKAGNRKPEALQHLEFVLRAADNNPFTYLNVGLLYADLKEYDLALVQAHKAMKLGLNRVELSDKLKAAGKWQEPVTSDGQGAQSGPSAAASAAKQP